MKYVVSGPAVEVLIRENRVRIQRGVLSFTPLTEAQKAPEAPVDDTKAVEAPQDSKEVRMTDKKKPKKTKK
jgi:hypothetical protein